MRTNVQSLFNSERIDTRKQLNRSTILIPEEVLKSLDSGLSSEQLEQLNVPVFKYKTQITVHGHFTPPTGTTIKEYVNGYKSLILNDNGSLGVKYKAIDAGKKELIYTTLELLGWGSTLENSTQWISERNIRFETKEQLVAIVEEAKQTRDRLNQVQYIGTFGVQTFNIMGMRWASIYLSVNAIKSEHVLPLLEAVTNSTDIEKRANDILEEKHAAEVAKNIQENKERLERAAREKRKHEEFISRGYEYVRVFDPCKGYDEYGAEVELKREGKQVYMRKGYGTKVQSYSMYVLKTELVGIRHHPEKRTFFEYQAPAPKKIELNFKLYTTPTTPIKQEFKHVQEVVTNQQPNTNSNQQQLELF